jgi:CBS domain containing-hemolysin-like protein
MAKVQTVSLQSDREVLLEKLRENDFTRRLVVDEQAGSIVGFINIYDVLCSSEKFEDLGGFVKPIRRLDAGTPITEAIELVQSEDLRIVLVTRSARMGHVRNVGILTMKDLAEELLGELAQW